MSVVLLRPPTNTARRWIDPHVETESWQWFGNAWAVKPRRLDVILQAFTEEVL